MMSTSIVRFFVTVDPIIAATQHSKTTYRSTNLIKLNQICSDSIQSFYEFRCVMVSLTDFQPSLTSKE